SSRRRHTRFSRDWSSDVCSSDLLAVLNTADQLRESLAGAAEIAEQIGGTKLGRLGSMLGDTSALRGLVASLGRGEAALIGISDIDRKSVGEGKCDCVLIFGWL